MTTDDSEGRVDDEILMSVVGEVFFLERLHTWAK